jgi:hypothetical protein
MVQGITKYATARRFCHRNLVRAATRSKPPSQLANWGIKKSLREIELVSGPEGYQASAKNNLDIPHFLPCYFAWPSEKRQRDSSVLCSSE